MSIEPSEAPEESHWTTEWSAQSLTEEEMDAFEDVIADLYDWIVLSVDSCYAAVKRHCSSLPVCIKKGNWLSSVYIQ
jgi:hypothetical protein